MRENYEVIKQQKRIPPVYMRAHDIKSLPKFAVLTLLLIHHNIS